MPLNKEWKSRIDSWMKELPNHFYRELGAVELTGFTTMEHFDRAEALSHSFVTMPAGTPWGAKWEYAWFKGRIELPEEAKGKRIVLRLDVGAESMVFVNSSLAGAKDLEHHEITLCGEGQPGEVYEILTESYGGHGPREENCPPTPPGRLTIPEPPTAQTRVGRSTFGIWEEEAYQLWLDVNSLYQVRSSINENDLRTAEIDKGLKDFTLIVDFELPHEERMKTFRAGRERLKPLLSCVNGSTAPTMYLFGHSHLDLAWMWPFAETERKCARTLSTQMALLEEYPEYVFFLSQPPIYEVLKKRYPELHRKVLDKVKEGRIIAEGAMWVEADTNLTGGESLIRQFIYGRRYFREELGTDSTLLWLPDVFGFTAALPQIMKGCGVKYFATQKIFCNYNGGDPFPYNDFMWEGIDGSKVLANLFLKQNSLVDPGTVIRRWDKDRRQLNDISALLFPFGYGDGGGGPTRDHLEYTQRIKDLEGVPRTKMASPVAFFRELEEKVIPENRYVGEIYFQAHRGTYTSQAKTKKGNRKSEFALRETEFWASAARVLNGLAYPQDLMDELWKKLLLNQFHDIIPGSSIERVHREAERDYRDIQARSGEACNSAVHSLIRQDKGIAVFNSLSWPRKELIALPEGYTCMSDPEGNSLPVQFLEGQCLVEVEVPSCGWATFSPSDTSSPAVTLSQTGAPFLAHTSPSSGASISADTLSQSGAPSSANTLLADGISGETKNTLNATGNSLENELVRVELNESGEITLILDKQTGRKLSSGICNSFKMYKDVTTQYDAWDIDSMYEKLPVELTGNASIEVIANGPLIAGIRVGRKLHDSFLTQEITLRKNSRKIEFKTVIDWKESHKLLKVAFPVDIYAQEAIHEIQFGHVKRPTHKSRPYDADRYEVCNHKWTAIAEPGRGYALLNDCKYGISVSDGCMNLTLLKSALVPDMTADKGVHEFTYAFYFWNGPIAQSGVVQAAYELNSPVLVHGGSAGSKSLFSLDHPGIIIETVKPAEDRSADIIVRMYESAGTKSLAVLQTSLPILKVSETDMLENDLGEVAFENGRIALEFRPFEIKTIRLAVQE